MCESDPSGAGTEETEPAPTSDFHTALIRGRSGPRYGKAAPAGQDNGASARAVKPTFGLSLHICREGVGVGGRAALSCHPLHPLPEGR